MIDIPLNDGDTILSIPGHQMQRMIEEDNDYDSKQRDPMRHIRGFHNANGTIGMLKI
jgi:hypothetical protein